MFALMMMSASVFVVVTVAPMMTSRVAVNVAVVAVVIVALMTESWPEPFSVTFPAPTLIMAPASMVASLIDSSPPVPTSELTVEVPVTVRPAVEVSSMFPPSAPTAPLVTLPVMLRSPPPLWSKLMVAPTVVKEMTVVVETRLLSMSIVPVDVSASIDSMLVSSASAAPMPVTASMAVRPLAEMMSAPPVSPPSTIPPAVLVSWTAVVVALVVISCPSVTSSLADRLINPLSALMTVPSAIVSDPWSVPPPAAAMSASAVTVTFPEVLVTSPSASNETSLSAVSWIAPVAD